MGGPHGGNVWFAAANGVTFGNGADVDTGGLLATTAGIADGQFLFGPNGLDDVQGDGWQGVMNYMGGKLTSDAPGRMVAAGGTGPGEGR